MGNLKNGKYFSKILHWLTQVQNRGDPGQLFQILWRLILHFQVIHSSPRTESKFEGSMANQNMAVGNSLVVQGLEGLSCSSNGKESACSAGGHKRRGFHPWVRKILSRRKWQPTPVFLPEKSHGQRSLAGYSYGVAKSWMQLSTRQNSPVIMPIKPLKTSYWSSLDTISPLTSFYNTEEYRYHFLPSCTHGL